MMTAVIANDSEGESEVEECKVLEWDLSTSENHSSKEYEMKDSETCAIGNTVSLDEHFNNNQSFDASQPFDNAKHTGRDSKKWY